MSNDFECLLVGTLQRLAQAEAERDALLEALKGLVAWADDLRRDDPVEDLRKARAAIAKAGGSNG